LKPFFHNFSLPIYDFDVRLCLCDSIRATVEERELHAHVNYNFEVAENFDPAGVWISRGRKGLMMFERRCLSHELIAHEMSHAVDDVFEYREIKWGPKGCGETAALLRGFLATQIYSCLIRWKAKIK